LRAADAVASDKSMVSDQNAEVVLATASVWAGATVGLLLYLACVGFAVAALRGRSKALRVAAWLVLALCACMVVAAVVQRNNAIHLYDPSHDPLHNFTEWGPT
jgi:cytochrome c biogenesis protein CcdA